MVFLLNSFRNGPAGPFKQVSTVPDANSNTCFKRGGKHQGGQCSASAPKSGFPFGSKGKIRVLHSKPVTPVRVEQLDFLLNGYHRVLKQFLVDGFRFGFRIQFVGERFLSESPNLKSALDQPVVTHAKLRKECDAGRILNPFTAPPFQIFVALHWALLSKRIRLNFD